MSTTVSKRPAEARYQIATIGTTPPISRYLLDREVSKVVQQSAQRNGFGLLPRRPVECSTPKTAGWSSPKARPEDPVRGEPAQVRTEFPGWPTPAAGRPLS